MRGLHKNQECWQRSNSLFVCHLAIIHTVGQTGRRCGASCLSGQHLFSPQHPSVHSANCWYVAYDSGDCLSSVMSPRTHQEHVSRHCLELPSGNDSFRCPSNSVTAMTRDITTTSNWQLNTALVLFCTKHSFLHSTFCFFTGYLHCTFTFLVTIIYMFQSDWPRNNIRAVK